MNICEVNAFIKREYIFWLGIYINGVYLQCYQFFADTIIMLNENQVLYNFVKRLEE